MRRRKRANSAMSAAVEAIDPSAVAVSEPRCRHERRARVADPVVVEVLVADGEALADVVRDRRLGGGHAERVQDATADDLGVRSAVDRLEHQAERFVADVRVVEPLAGRRRRRQVAQRPDLEGRLGRGVDPGDDACGVRQQVRDGDRRRAGGWGTANHGRYSATGASRLSAPSSASCSPGHRRERLPDRADLEERLGALPGRATRAGRGRTSGGRACGRGP